MVMSQILLGSISSIQVFLTQMKNMRFARVMPDSDTQIMLQILVPLSTNRLW